MTTMNTAVTSALAEVSRIGAEIAALREEAKRRRQEAIEPFFEALAASGEVSIIVVRGHTPGFNDGEPCEHSSDFFVNVQQLCGDEVGCYGFSDRSDWFGEHEPEDFYNGLSSPWSRDPVEIEANRQICASVGHVYDKPSDDVMKAISELIYATVEEDNGTDYWVAYILKDGKFERSSGDYDCGY